MAEPVSFGWWLKERRRELDLTQEALAERVGYSVDTIRKIERDARRPSRQMAELLAGVLAVPPEQKEQFVQRARGKLRANRILGVSPLPPYPQSTPHNLPVPLTSFVGREDERARVAQFLGSVRLLTLTGAGGSGKTRLALQVSHDVLDAFAHGVFFVSLVGLSDPSLLTSTVISALGLREEGSRSPLDTLKAVLRGKQVLLVLDNFEHLLPSASWVEEMLHSVSDLKVLVTTREPLHLSGEYEFPVSPLATPELDEPQAVEMLLRYPSVGLFVDRARAVDPDFAVTEENAKAIAELCVHLDGLPLAIELAAARIKLFSPQAMVARLGSRFRWLTTGRSHLPGRHQTLRKAIDWSYDLLEAEERRLFERLSVFASGCTIEAAEAICDSDGAISLDVFEGLASLVDKNLITQEEVLHGEPRFGMLETIREYAREKLAASGEAEAAQRRHFDYFARMAQAAEAERRGPNEAHWLGRLSVEHDNLSTAVRYGLNLGEAELTLQFVTALEWFWSLRGYLSEGSERLDRVLAASRHVATPTRVKALTAAEHLAQKRGDFASKKRYADEHLRLCTNVGDVEGIASALHSLGDVARDLDGNYAKAAGLLQESLALFRELREIRGMAGVLNCLGEVARCQEQYEQAREFYEESLAMEQQSGDQERVGLVTFNLASVYLNEGVLGKADSLLKSSLTLSQELGNLSIIAVCLAGLAGIARGRGDALRAARLLAAATVVNESIGAQLAMADRLLWDRTLAATRGELESETFSEVWAEGVKMTLEQAIAYALA